MDLVSKVKNDNKKIECYSWSDVHKLIDGMADVAKKKEITNIYGIPRGGLIVAVMLSHKLNLPLITDKGLISKNTLIVDDIEDSSNTMKHYKQLFPDSLFFAMVSKKGIDKCTCDFYVGFCSIKIWAKFPWEE